MYCVLYNRRRKRSKDVKLSNVHFKVEVGNFQVINDDVERVEMKVLKDTAEEKSAADSEFSGAIFMEKFPDYVKLMHRDRDSAFEEHFQVSNIIVYKLSLFYYCCTVHCQNTKRILFNSEKGGEYSQEQI